MLLILVGSEKEWSAHPAIKLVLDTVRKEGEAVKLFFLHDELMTPAMVERHGVMLSQTSRLFGALILKGLLPSTGLSFSGGNIQELPRFFIHMFATMTLSPVCKH
jgi:hypothetical protein